MEKRWGRVACLTAALFLCQILSVMAMEPSGDLPPVMGHSEQMRELGPEIQGDVTSDSMAIQMPEPAGISKAAMSPVVKSGDFIVLAYPQDMRPADSYMWHSITHVTSTFMDFDETGNITNPANWTSRNAALAKGGTADRYGVKVLMCVRNSGFDLSVITTVMNDAKLRSNLVNNIMTLVNDSTSNAAGVTLDLEPAEYGSSVAGITAFLQELKGRLGDKELSLYVSPSYQSAYTSGLATWMQSMDYLIYSCYPWSGSWSTTLAAISPLSSYKGQVDNYIKNGCPPEKIVLALSAYGGEASTATPAYAATKTSTKGLSSMGFAKGKFMSTLSAAKKTRQYQEGQESAWYSSSNGTDYDTAVYDDEFSLGVKIRGALSWQGSQYPGRRLRGVGYWSLMWMTDNYFNSFYSRDLETNTNVTSGRYRTYPQIYQTHMETLAPPGTRTFPIDKWEHVEGRWRSPNNGSDTIGCSAASVTSAASPAGTGKPDNSTYAARVTATFTATANNRVFWRHEILGHYTENTIPDRNAAKALFDANTRLDVDLYSAAAYSGRTVRFMLMDANGELEMGPQISLNYTGWKTQSLDLTRTTVSGYVTKLKEFKSGNGVLNTAGGGAKDIACVGFLIEGGGTAGSVNLYFDELRYTKVIPQGCEYVINELRYSPSTAQFVEIYGPAGTFPVGMQLKFVSGSDGAAYSTVVLGGKRIPNDNNGYGYFVVGSSAAPNVDYAIDDGLIKSDTVSAVQLYDTTSGAVCDAVVYRAFGGLFSLDGNGDPRVTQNGYPWVGGLGDGTGSSGGVYSVGRTSDGVNTWVNYKDFNSMAATPGTSNMTSVALPTSYNFESIPTNAVQTFQSLSVVTPPAAVGNSPGGGKVYRCVDTSGGGVQSFIGGPNLGNDGNGYTATGEIYIPKSTDPVQAIGIGICGNRGSAFFSSAPASSGYEDGYWLIFENAAGAALADDRPDHPGMFEFVQAQNNNTTNTATRLLGRKSLANVGLTAAGGWTTFKFTVNPKAAVSEQLSVELNGTTVYKGALPENGPTFGAFQVGFRENHTGAPATNEGVWIDTLKLTSNGEVGSLKVTVEPAGAVSAGAQWSIDGGVTWKNSDTTLTNLSVGTYTVTFKSVAGWTAPSSRYVTVSTGVTATSTGTYVQQTGSLKVTILPSGAVSSGAQWSIDNGVTWNNSDAVASGVPVGTYTVKFKDLTGWGTPASQQAIVSNGAITSLSATYTQYAGNLQVMIAPGAAAADGAEWSIDGLNWYNSGDVVSNLPVGNYRVSFNSIAGWQQPSSVSVTVSSGQTTTITGTYIWKTGSLDVTITPAAAVAAGARWSLDGTEWHDSGTILSDLPVGDYTVFFKYIAGWEQPVSQDVSVKMNITTSIAGNYTQSVGSLKVSLSPQEAVDKGAAWILNGTEYSSGAQASNLPVGTYTVKFKETPGWIAPPDQLVTVTAGTVSELTDVYTKDNTFDLALFSGDFTAGVDSALVPGMPLDIQWNLSSNETTSTAFWCEAFASKTGGFDQVRFGSTVTNSYVQNGATSGSQTIAPTNQILKTLPDGVYSLMPTVNRYAARTMDEVSYVNNWDTIAGKRLRVRTTTAATADLIIKDAFFKVDDATSQIITVTGTVCNEGTSANAECWLEVFYGDLSMEWTLDPKATIAPGILIGSLNPGAEQKFTVSGWIPGGAAQYALAAIADSTDIVPESNEVNNNAMRIPSSVVPTPPQNGVDLAITDMKLNPALTAPNQIAPGTPFDCTVTVKNNGVSANGCWLEVFGSQDGGVSFVRGSGLVDGLFITPPAPGASQTYSFAGVAVKALGDGMYTPVAVVNRYGVAFNPGDQNPVDNRYKFSAGRISLSTPPETGAVNIVWSDGPIFEQNGNVMTISGKIKNIGNAAAKPFWTEAFTGSLDAQMGTFVRDARVFAGGQYCSGLNPSAEQSVNIAGNVLPDQIVGVIADSTDLVSETDETDNYDYSELTQ